MRGAPNGLFFSFLFFVIVAAKMVFSLLSPSPLEVVCLFCEVKKMHSPFKSSAAFFLFPRQAMKKNLPVRKAGD